MAEYQFEGFDKAGKKTAGKLDVLNEIELRMMLRNQGIRPTKIFKASKGSLGSLLKGRMASVDLVAVLSFTRQIQILISSGVPLVQALELLTEQTTDGNLRTIVFAVKERVSQGSYLWEALSSYPQAFPKLYVSLVRAGEASGTVDQMLKRLGRYLEDADRLKRMIKSAMMYPLMVIMMAGGIVSLMMVFVIPKFEDLLRSSGQTLPWMTQALISISHFMIENLLYLGVGVGSIFYLSQRYFRSSEGRAFLDRLMFRVPVFGGIMQKGGMARFSRTLQTLLGAGINLIDAIDICRTTIDNAVLEDAVSRIRAEIEAGKTLGAVMGRMSVFPRMAIQMIAVGESTGNLDKMLEKVADYYEEETETVIKGLTKIIEPLIFLVLGGVVGGIMIAMYLPVFKLADAIQ